MYLTPSSIYLMNSDGTAQNDTGIPAILRAIGWR